MVNSKITAMLRICCNGATIPNCLFPLPMIRPWIKLACTCKDEKLEDHSNAEDPFSIASLLTPIPVSKGLVSHECPVCIVGMLSWFQFGKSFHAAQRPLQLPSFLRIPRIHTHQMSHNKAVQASRSITQQCNATQRKRDTRLAQKIQNPLKIWAYNKS
jgi:hypothetical protein